MHPNFDRSQGIGASDAGAAIGVNPNKSPFQLWREKTKEIIPPDISNNLNIKRGVRMEPLIRKWVKEDLGITIRKDNKTHFSETYPFLYSHTDGFIKGKKRIAEIKAPSLYMLEQYGPEHTDQIPDYYLAQGIHMLTVQPEIEGIDYFVQFPGHEIKQYILDREDHLIKSYVKAITRFWDFVVHKTPPPPVNNDDLNVIYKESNKKMMPYDVQTEVLVKDLIKIRKKIKEFQIEEKSMTFDVKNHIGNYDYFTMSDGGKVNLSRVKRKLFDEEHLKNNEEEYYNYCNLFNEKDFKKEKPLLHDKYSEEVISLRLILPKINQ